LRHNFAMICPHFRS